MKNKFLILLGLLGGLTASRADTIYNLPAGHFSVVVADGQSSPYLNQFGFGDSSLIMKGSFGGQGTVPGTSSYDPGRTDLETSFSISLVPDDGWSFTSVNGVNNRQYNYHNGYGPNGYIFMSDWTIAGVDGSRAVSHFPPWDQGGGGGGDWFGLSDAVVLVPAGGFTIDFHQLLYLYGTTSFGVGDLYFGVSLVNEPAPTNPSKVPDVSPTIGLLLAGLGMMGLMQRKLRRSASGCCLQAA